MPLTFTRAVTGIWLTLLIGCAGDATRGPATATTPTATTEARTSRTAPPARLERPAPMSKPQRAQRRAAATSRPSRGARFETLERRQLLSTTSGLTATYYDN